MMPVKNSTMKLLDGILCGHSLVDQPGKIWAMASCMTNVGSVFCFHISRLQPFNLLFL